MRDGSFVGSSDRPTPEQREAAKRRFNAPDNELPGAAAVSGLLGRTDGLAVGITTVEAYTAGFSFSIAVRVRNGRAGRRGHQLHELIVGHSRDGSEAPTPDERLLLGLEYADGRLATNIEPIPWLGDPDAADLPDDTLVLSMSGGGGGSSRFDYGYWVTPLPPPGPLTFVCAWQALGITETRTTVDAGAVLDAASRAVVLWPWQPEEPEPLSPSPPPAPSSGWFADAVRRRPDQPN